MQLNAVSLLMDFNTRFVSSGVKARKTRKCDRVIYIMTVVGILNAIQIDATKTHAHIYHSMVGDTDKYKDCSEVTEQPGRRKKTCFMLPF